MTVLTNPGRFAPIPNLLAITNPGGETGDLTGWTSLVGAPENVATTAALAAPRSGGGSRFFHGGASARSVLRQNVAIPSGFNANIDAHTAFINYRYWTACANSDASLISIDFLNAGGIIIGTFVPKNGTTYDFDVGTTWRQKSYCRKIPALTRSINIDFNGWRVSGTPLDANVDDIEAWISTGLQYPIELPINNPNADVGAITGWTNTVGNPSTTATSGSGMLPLIGRNYFYPGTTVASTMTQDIAMPAAALADIDAGLVTLVRDWYMAGPADADNFQMGVQAFDGAMASLGTQNAPTSSDGAAPNGWVFKTIDYVLPALTRTIRLFANGGRITGTSNDGYSTAYAARLQK